MEIESLEEEKEGVKLKLIFGSFFLILVILLLAVYWIIPRESAINFIGSNGEFLACSNYEFGNASDIQFYENMRYFDSNISYRIKDCPIQKTISMEKAFYEVENKTVLSFYEVSKDEEILITCDSKTRIDGSMFIAGEGGPSNITKIDSFYIISQGSILLIKESTCGRPTVAIHELFHALGFYHSENVCNIMHNFSKCSQNIGNDMIELIEELYSEEPFNDLKIGYINGNIHDEYLDLNFSIQNNGFTNSKKSLIRISSEDTQIKEIDIPEIIYGSGIEVTQKNIKIKKSTKEIKVEIVYGEIEIDKKNNVGLLIFNN